MPPNSKAAPSISGATITPASLPFGGGTVTINALIKNATRVQLDVTTPGVFVNVSLPVTVPVTVSRTFTLSASGTSGKTATVPLSVTVAPAVNNAPAWSAQPAAQFTQGTAGVYNAAPLASDANGDPLAFGLDSGTLLPAGVALNSVGQFSYDGRAMSAPVVINGSMWADDGK